MTVALSKSNEEIQQMPLVELAWEIFKAKKEPIYFRDLMSLIQELRGMSDEQVNEVIARLYTEINIDGRFICIGQNVWGLNRWYPVDKVAERALSGKKFVRRSGDAFSEDDEDDDEFEDLTVDDDIEDALPLYGDADEDTDDVEDDALLEEDEEAEELEEEEVEDGDFDEEPLLDEEDDEEEED